nr:hypothetical protein [Bacillus sp. M6-12]
MRMAIRIIIKPLPGRQFQLETGCMCTDKIFILQKTTSIANGSEVLTVNLKEILVTETQRKSSSADRPNGSILMNTKNASVSSMRFVLLL